MTDNSLSEITKLYVEGVIPPKAAPSANHTSTITSNIPSGAVPPEQEEVTPEPQLEQKPVKKIAGILQKLDRENIDKSEILVVGYGVVTLGALKENVSKKFEDLAHRVKKDEPMFVLRRVTERYGFLMHAVKALVDVEKQIEKLRRAGKMPGMIKRYTYSS